MLKILDSNHKHLIATRDANGKPVALETDSMQLQHFVFDMNPAPKVTATYSRVHAGTGAEAGPVTQFYIGGDQLKNLLPSIMPHVVAISEILDKFISEEGDFPGAEFKGKVQHDSSSIGKIAKLAEKSK